MAKKRCSNKKARALLEQLDQKYTPNEVARDQQKNRQTSDPVKDLPTEHQQN